MRSIKETDLFLPIKGWLEERGYEVFSEIENDYRGNRADIVGINGPVTAVVELKTTLSIDLIGQAIDWLPYANLVYIGIPRGKREINPHASRILRYFGIGIFLVSYYDRFKFVEGWHCCEFVEAKFNRYAVTDWKRKLTDEYKNGPPGGHAGGGYVTRYKLMMDKVREFIHERTRDGQWLTIEQILEHCWTYYRYPKQSLSSALLKIENDWCEVSKINGKLVFRAKRLADPMLKRRDLLR